MMKTINEFLLEASIMAESDQPSNEILSEEEAKDVTLNKPIRTSGERKKFKVYVKNDKGNVVVVRFGDPNLSIKRDDPERRKNFRARHNCSDASDKTSPRYSSCKMWSKESVTDIINK